MKKGSSLALGLLCCGLLSLTGCDRIDAWLHPRPMDAAVTQAPPPPIKTQVQLYAGDKTPVMQARSGDCVTAQGCYIFRNGNWQKLATDQANSVPMLAILPPAGSAYSDDLWRPVGSQNRYVLLNDAGHDNFESWLFDGRRIGLMSPSRTTYITVYAIEDGKSLSMRGVCTRGDSPDDEGDGTKAGCALRVAPGLYLTGDSGDIFIANGSVWMLYQRGDGSAQLIDLFAILAEHKDIVCLPGLILDTTGTPSGPIEKSLSPDIFVSRASGPDFDGKRRDATMHACYPPAAKATP